MNKTLLFLIYSCFFVSFFGIAAHSGVSQETSYSLITGVTSTDNYKYPLLMYVVNRVYTPFLASFEGGRKRNYSPTSVADEVCTEGVVKPLCKRQASDDKAIQRQQEKFKNNLLAEVVLRHQKADLELVPNDTDHIVMRRQVSFNSKVEVREESGLLITVDTGKEEQDTLRRIISGDLRRTGSGLQECFIASPQPATPVSDCAIASPQPVTTSPVSDLLGGVRSRANSSDSGVFFLASIPSVPSSPVTKRKEIMPAIHATPQLRRQYSKGSNRELQGFHPEEEDVAKKFAKGHCPVSPTSPDTKN